MGNMDVTIKVIVSLSLIIAITFARPANVRSGVTHLEDVQTLREQVKRLQGLLDRIDRERNSDARKADSPATTDAPKSSAKEAPETSNVEDVVKVFTPTDIRVMEDLSEALREMRRNKLRRFKETDKYEYQTGVNYYPQRYSARQFLNHNADNSRFSDSDERNDRYTAIRRMFPRRRPEYRDRDNIQVERTYTTQQDGRESMGNEVGRFLDTVRSHEDNKSDKLKVIEKALMNVLSVVEKNGISLQDIIDDFSKQSHNVKTQKRHMVSDEEKQLEALGKSFYA